MYFTGAGVLNSGNQSLDHQIFTYLPLTVFLGAKSASVHSILQDSASTSAFTPLGQGNSVSSSLDLNANSTDSYHELSLPRLSPSKIQPIPPSFIPTDPTLYLVNGRPINATHEAIERAKPQWKRKVEFWDAHKRREQHLELLRNSTVSLPYTEEELRASVMNSTNESTVWTRRPRSEYYEADPNYQSGHAPVLMDGFTYCEGTTLVVEVLFNLRYMYVKCGKQKTRETMLHIWECTHANQTARNIYIKDKDKHVIISEYKFPNSCHLANDHYYEIRSLNESSFTYALNLEFLPDFTQQRYYLSLCTSIEYAPRNQVIAFINHHFFHGVQHFIFYINGQLPHWKNELKAYAEHGVVELVDFTYPNHGPFYEQAIALNSCNRRYRYTTQFMIYCDVDEFFLPLNPAWRVVDVVKAYDEVYPGMDAFSVRNDFYACNYHDSVWSQTMQLHEACAERTAKVVKGERQKCIVRVRTTKYVQVHIISYGKRMYMNHNKDIVMIHFKAGYKRVPGTPIYPNPFVSQALQRALLCYVYYRQYKK